MLNPSRRDVLKVVGLTALGFTLADWFRCKAALGADRPARDVSCILIWLDGGPSHLDTFDLKPDAPAEVRGPFAPIATTAPGVSICEYLPKMAQLMDRAGLVRSMTSPLGEHNLGSHYLLTGYKPTPVLTYPSFGSVVSHVRPSGDLPSYVAVPDANEFASHGYLPASAGPFEVGGDPSRPDFKVRDLESFPGVTAARLARRREFLDDFDRFSRGVESGDRPADPQFEQAYRLISSPEVKRAFDLAAEPADVRERYGHRTLGQSCLLARRLIEAGAKFVTVTDRGWDTHQNLFYSLKEGFTGGSVGKLPILDSAWSALISDLAERGLLDNTLVVLMGEFGRTPKLNTLGGRDHWPRVFSVLLAGGGVAGGQVVGSSDSRGESPADRAVIPEDLACTIYSLLGIDAEREFATADGRPVRVTQGGERIHELIG